MARFRLLLPAALIVLAGCAGTSGGASSPTAAATSGESAPASAVPAESPGPGGPLGSDVPVACLNLDENDCARVLEAALGSLPPDARQLRYVEVGPFGCQGASPCPFNLAARPSGQVTFEPVAGEPVALQVSSKADGSLDVAAGEAFMVSVDPSSAAGQLASGPVAFSLGHCGLWSGVDADGSWWDIVGPVDFDHGDAINAAEGTLALTDPNHATFTSAGGLVVNLVRRVGPKLLPLCQ